MKVDLAELIKDVEARFHIRIAASLVSWMETAGDLHRCVELELAPRRVPRERTADAVAFDAVRRSLIADRNPMAERMTRETRLEELFPIAYRRTAWKQFQERLEYEVPDLAMRYSWLVYTMDLVVAFLVSMWTAAYFPELDALTDVRSLVTYIPGIVVGGTLHMIIDQFNTGFPEEWTTAGELVDHLCTEHKDALSEAGMMISAESSWVVLAEVICKKAGRGLRPEDLRKGHRLTDIGFE